MLSLILQAVLTVATVSAQAPGGEAPNVVLDVPVTVSAPLQVRLATPKIVRATSSSRRVPLEVVVQQHEQQHLQPHVQQARSADQARAARTVAVLARQEPRQTRRSSAPEQRGLLGVGLIDDGRAGVRISTVTANSAAARGGLLVGDRILALDSHPTDDIDRIATMIQERAPGTEVRLRVRRELTIELVDERRTPDGRLALGVTLSQAQQDPRSALEVSSVTADGSAKAAGMRPRDRIVAIEGDEVENYAALVARMREIEAPRRISVRVERDVELELGSASASVDPRAADAPNVRRFRLGVLGEDVPDESRLSPPRTTVPSNLDARQLLQHELRELADELQSLRRELAELREELRDLRPRQRPR